MAGIPIGLPISLLVPETWADLSRLLGAVLVLFGATCVIRPLRSLRVTRRSTGLLVILAGLVLVSIGQLQQMPGTGSGAKGNPPLIPPPPAAAQDATKSGG